MKQKYAVLYNDINEEYGGGPQFASLKTANHPSEGKYFTKNFNKAQKVVEMLEQVYPYNDYQIIIVSGDI